MADIIIPIYGGLTHVQKLISSLEKTVSPAHKVIFGDDFTPDTKSRFALLSLIEKACEKHPNWLLYKSDKNTGYSAINNKMATLGNSDKILMLNSDTEGLTPGWVDEMEATIDDHFTVGGVGAKLTFPSHTKDAKRPAGKIQHAGVAFNTGRAPFHIFLGWPADHPKVNRPLMMKACTGACLMVRRDLYEAVGGLNEIYGIGNFEDIELCLSVTDLGYDIAYNPKVHVAHWGSGSGNTLESSKNLMTFLGRWQEKIVCDDWVYY